MRTFPRAFARGCVPTLRAVGAPALAALVSLLLVVTIAVPAVADPAAEQFKRDIEELRRQQADVAAEARGATFLPGTRCFAGGQGDDAIRLAFSFLPADQIAEGVARIGAAMREIG